MTDLAIRDTYSEQNGTDPTGGRLVAWASGLAAAHRIGTALCSTAFVPAHFKGKPDEAAAAILFGDEIGLSPTQALRSVYLISGTPALYARTMVALVLHHGHDIYTVEKTDAKVTVAGKRRGSSHVIQETWTTARAQKAGYTKNTKYATDPSAMLYARAAADVCRQIAPDALAGLAFTVEELEVAEPEPTTTIRRAEPSTTARRAVVVAAEPDPEPPTLTADEPIPTDEQTADAQPEQPLTQRQSAALHASLADHGLSDREAGLAYISETVNREVASSKDLSRTEASAVIDRLKAEAAIGAEPPLAGWDS